MAKFYLQTPDEDKQGCQVRGRNTYLQLSQNIQKNGDSGYDFPLFDSESRTSYYPCHEMDGDIHELQTVVLDMSDINVICATSEASTRA